ncbi:hypothetical protein [Telluribacter sp.]|jgi:hypothetical protein|uniref:hypothetical protein n=1 Tax=Telluribacter sp. TaxID=1978767 RepID=UPI002E0EA63D|nr:hypothetical protein [Telluribacter sp.]
MRTFLQLSGWFYRQATGRIVLFFLALQIAFNVLVFPNLQARMGGDTQANPLDLRFGFTAEEAYAYLDSLGAEGRDVYQWTEQVADGVYPIVYTLLLIFLITYFFKKVFAEGSLWRRFNLLPFLVMLADFLENIGIVTMLNHFPEQAEGAAQLAATANLLKWSFFPIMIILVLIGLGGVIYYKVSNRKILA